MDEAEMRSLVDRYVAAYNALDVDGMLAGETLRLDGRSEFGFRDGAIDRITDYG